MNGRDGQCLSEALIAHIAFGYFISTDAQENLAAVILGIVLLSYIPIIIEIAAAAWRGQQEGGDAPS